LEVPAIERRSNPTKDGYDTNLTKYRKKLVGHYCFSLIAYWDLIR
jgi:hypothetical protein